MSGAGVVGGDKHLSENSIQTSNIDASALIEVYLFALHAVKYLIFNSIMFVFCSSEDVTRCVFPMMLSFVVLFTEWEAR